MPANHSTQFDFVGAMEQHSRGKLPRRQVVQLFQWLIDHDVLLSPDFAGSQWHAEARALIAAGWCHAKHERRH